MTRPFSAARVRPMATKGELRFIKVASCLPTLYRCRPTVVLVLFMSTNLVPSEAMCLIPYEYTESEVSGGGGGGGGGGQLCCQVKLLTMSLGVNRAQGIPNPVADVTRYCCSSTNYCNI